MGRPKKSSTATAAKKVAATSKKSAATVKGQTTLKTQTTLKNSVAKSATANTATTGINFKASKVTRSSQKKKEEVVKVEVEKTVVEEDTATATTTATATATTASKTGATATKTVENKKEEPKEEPKEEKAPVTPRKTRKRTIDDAVEDSVVKRARLDDALDEPIQTPTPSKRRVTSSIPAASQSKTTKAAKRQEKSGEEEEEEEEEDNALPKRILRLITIHNSIISLLLLDYATQPAILSEYLPQISRNANTNITLVDLQRIVTLSKGTVRLVKVENRGNAIELVNGVNWKTSNLGQEFRTTVEKWWEGKTKAQRKDEDKLLGSIELAEILPEENPSSQTTGLQTPPVTPSKPKGLATTAPLSKGQRRLQDLKGFALSKQASLSPSPSKKKENISVSTGKSPSVANRNSSLLERIRAKAQAANSAPAPPPPEVLQRRTAMQWLESIIPILLQLTTPASTLGAKSKLHVPSTTSFPMTTVIQNVKTSLQKPISTEDVERSLRVLADEVASDFVKIVEWKGDSTGSPLVGVVFNRNGRAKVEGWKYVEEEEEKA
ncbi:hypothetical protein TWF718_008682 [Orbilia javanica]|uniref:DNA replication factor Cdt1 C-terminal domain-containing protein n=1 Tax=Orbilia javanica TaxID=47235 RepID=A0AAN8RFL6_9PEZI